MKSQRSKGGHTGFKVPELEARQMDFESNLAFFGKDKCVKLVKYDGKVLEFGTTVEEPPVKVEIKGKYETTAIRAASGIALAIDDYQYFECLTANKYPKGSPERRTHIENSSAAVLRMTKLRLAVEVWLVDPRGQEENLQRAVKEMQDFNIDKTIAESFAARGLMDAARATHERTLSEAFKAVGLSEVTTRNLIDKLSR